jgi:hypothetical protein
MAHTRHDRFTAGDCGEPVRSFPGDYCTTLFLSYEVNGSVGDGPSNNGSYTQRGVKYNVCHGRARVRRSRHWPEVTRTAPRPVQIAPVGAREV